MADKRSSIFGGLGFTRKRTQADTDNYIDSTIQRYINDRLDIIDAKGKSARGKSHSLSIAAVYATLKSQIFKALGYDSRDSFTAPEWDFKEVAEVLQTEAVFRRSVEKYVEQIWKNGFSFVGRNPQTVEYIKKRFNQIAMVTRKPTLTLMQEYAFSLVTYANTLVIKKRNLKSSGGKRRTTFDGAVLNPIAGLYIADPTIMWVKRDEYGNVKRWKQMPDDVWAYRIRGKTKSWGYRDVNHVQDRTATSPINFFAMPMVVPVIPDIKALREMEELSIVQGIKFSTPRYHATVGNIERPGTDPEVSQLANDLDLLPADAVLTTSGRAKVVNISSGDQVMDMTPLLKYWTDRIRGGLGLSGVSMGEGGTANRNTAQTMQSEMQTTSIKFQQIIKSGMLELIKELLYEAGWTEHTLREEDWVHLHIPEIDLANKMAKENHIMTLWNGDLITHDEARVELGYDILADADWEKLHSRMITEYNDKKAAENAAANSNQPENQYGKSASKPNQAKD